MVALFEELNAKTSDEKLKKILFNFENDKEYKYDVEHIFLQIRFKEREEDLDYLNGIGNLTLLEQSINRNVKDDLKKKYIEYKNSKLSFPRQIIKDSNMTPYDFNWTIGDIKNRIKKVEELFKRNFKILGN